MMTHLSYWLTCTLVLFTWEARPVGTEENSKYVCSGDSIQLFQNYKIDHLNMVVFLFINGAQSHQIAMWTMQGPTIADGYSKKVFHDTNGDVWIRNAHPSDEALYTLKWRKGNNSSTSDVYLRVLELTKLIEIIGVLQGMKENHLVILPPTRNCKPRIQRMGDILSVSLDANDCGKPIASVYWLDYPDIHYEGKDLIKLPPKYKAGTYYACIEGPATRCERNSTLSEYCSGFTTGDISSELRTESSRIESSYVMLIVIIVVLPVVSVTLIVIICCRRKKDKDVRKGGSGDVYAAEKEKLTQKFGEENATYGNNISERRQMLRTEYELPLPLTSIYKT